ncbi:MAG: FtsX-like permease family protein [Pseudomonadota bacterium]
MFGVNKIAIQFSVRNLLRQKGRTLMTLASLIFGVTGLILSGGFVEDIFIQLREATIQSRLGHMQIYRQGFYENSTKEPYKYMIENPGSVEEYLGKLPIVEQSMKRIQFFGLINNGKTDMPIFGEGVEPGKEAAQLGDFFRIIDGRQITDDDEYGILLGEGVASAMDLSVGDDITVLANSPDGGLNSVELSVVGVFRTFSKDFDARAVRVTLPAAQELLYVESVHAIVVSIADTLQTDWLANGLKEKIGDKGYEIKTWFELDDFYAKTVELYKAQLGVLQLIILLVVLLSVGNSVSMTAYERVGEFGTLKALGKSSKDVHRLIIIESVILGVIGSALGVLVGVGLAALISAIGIPMPPPPGSNTGYTAYIRIVPMTLLIAFFIGFVATFLSALFAARGASKVPVVDALRENI